MLSRFVAPSTCAPLVAPTVALRRQVPQAWSLHGGRFRRTSATAANASPFGASWVMRVGASFAAGMLAGGAATGLWRTRSDQETGAEQGEYQRKLYVMRGVSGAGKSTLARDILKRELSSRGVGGGVEAYMPLARGFIFSTDDFFSVLEGASAEEHYKFDVKKLRANHERNRLRCEIAMELGITPLIVDNTNTCLWEMKPYVELARKHGYTVEFADAMKQQELDLDTLKRRVAGRATAGKDIPEAALQRMLARYETLPDDAEAAVAAVLSAENPFGRPAPQGDGAAK